MVYIRYIKKKNGKLVGPYLYKSVRVGNKIVGKYIGKAGPKELKKLKKKRKLIK